MDFNVYHFNYNDKKKKLDVESSGVVKSKKYFPVFDIDGSEYIFKPLSKTKPFTTPLYGCSEVFWSNVINKYFDSSAPIYKLAICDELETNEEKYHNQGTIVKSIINNNEKLVNLLEYYKANPDKSVDIENYVNYCGTFYDYRSILSSSIFKDNKELGESLAKQILISILRGDINYHYENVAFIYENNKLKKLAPPIDHEFSTMFLYPDIPDIYYLNYYTYLDALNLVAVPDDTKNIWPATVHKQYIIDNIDYICEYYPEVALDFKKSLGSFINDLKSNNLIIPNNKEYFYPFSTFDSEVGIMKYKCNDQKKAEELEKQISRVEINIEKYSQKIQKEVLAIATSLEITLDLKLLSQKVLKLQK